jgi:predicted aspartyl protease
VDHFARPIAEVGKLHQASWRKVAAALVFLTTPVLADVPRPGDSPGSTTAHALRIHDAVKIEPDGHGRVWAPVMINGKGPFHLIVDSGANRSAVTADVARSLGASLEEVPASTLHGVTGDSQVPMVAIESMSVGKLSLPHSSLPVVRDAAGGADGFLGLAGLYNCSVVMDFDHREFLIDNSGTVLVGSILIPAELSRGGLLMVDVRVRGVLVKAIIDTGADATIGNIALQKAIDTDQARKASSDQIVGAGNNDQPGHTAPLPPLALGPLRIQGARVSFGNVPVFEYFGLTRVPAMLIGMDIIGSLSSVALDYAHRTVQVRARVTG